MREEQYETVWIKRDHKSVETPFAASSDFMFLPKTSATRSTTTASYVGVPSSFHVDLPLATTNTATVTTTTTATTTAAVTAAVTTTASVTTTAVTTTASVTTTAATNMTTIPVASTLNSGISIDPEVDTVLETPSKSIFRKLESSPHIEVNGAQSTSNKPSHSVTEDSVNILLGDKSDEVSIDFTPSKVKTPLITGGYINRKNPALNVAGIPVVRGTKSNSEDESLNDVLTNSLHVSIATSTVTSACFSGEPGISSIKGGRAIPVAIETFNSNSGSIIHNLVFAPWNEMYCYSYPANTFSETQEGVKNRLNSHQNIPRQLPDVNSLSITQYTPANSLNNHFTSFQAISPVNTIENSAQRTEGSFQTPVVSSQVAAITDTSHLYFSTSKASSVLLTPILEDQTKPTAPILAHQSVLYFEQSPLYEAKSIDRPQQTTNASSTAAYSSANNTEVFSSPHERSNVVNHTGGNYSHGGSAIISALVVGVIVILILFCVGLVYLFARLSSRRSRRREAVIERTMRECANSQIANIVRPECRLLFNGQMPMNGNTGGHEEDGETLHTHTRSKE